MKRLAAFTLIELLIVISIIAILAAILLPALNTARERAYKIQCVGTMKQFCILNSLYSDAYSNWAIPVNYGWTGANYQFAWYTGYLGAIIKSMTGSSAQSNDSSRGWSKAFICPKATLATILDSKRKLYDIQRSYGINAVSQAPSTTTWGLEPRGWKMNKVIHPSVKINFIDATDWATTVEHSMFGNYYGIKGERWDSSCNAMTAYRHFHGANIAFYDGHVGSLDYKKIQGNHVYWFPY